MTNTENIPWKVLPSDLGDVPFYIIEFDKEGNCTSPAALDHLVETSKTKSDVLLFSHGWNNDWGAATGRYDRFAEQFTTVRRQKWRPPDRPFAPVLVGVFWPSTVLVAPWEKGPDIAAEGVLDADAAALAEELDPAVRQRFLQITAEPTEESAADLAAMLAPVLAGRTDEFGSDGAVSAEDLMESWRAAAQAAPAPDNRRPGGFIDDAMAEPPGTAVQPAAAGWNPIQWVRDGVRATTVLLMKDRAARVGGNGVADMLHSLADTSSQTRISLVGHSYGCIVVLSALCNGPRPSRAVDSVLLLQAALSCYAFADDVDGQKGGYHDAVARVRQPIITTYSAHDEPLTKFFHLAVRRRSDLAQAVIAGQPPSKFAALGGFGPQNVDAQWIDMPDVGQPYPLPADRRILAVDGTAYIESHGAVETPQTAWALLSQIRG